MACKPDIKKREVLNTSKTSGILHLITKAAEGRGRRHYFIVIGAHRLFIITEDNKWKWGQGGETGGKNFFKKGS